MKHHGNRYCSVCKTKLQKWGTTQSGAQRWRCLVCSSTKTRPRLDLTQALLLERFTAWLLGKKSQEELGVSARTWRSQIADCWNIVPSQPLRTEAYPVILLDGIRIGNRVCLIAKTTKRVIGWVWVSWESSMTWGLLLSQIPAPVVAVCDGQKGILLAISRCWLGTRVQRCQFHIWQNTRSKLTLSPKTEAGRELLQLVRDIFQADTVAKATVWTERVDKWEKIFGSYTKERTYTLQQGPHSRHWWYTHGRLRSSFRQVKNLLADRHLFTYLEDLTDEPVPRTTNHVEGGINSQLRTLLKIHRGLSQSHQERLVDWYLNSRTRERKPTRNCR